MRVLDPFGRSLSVTRRSLLAGAGAATGVLALGPIVATAASDKIVSLGGGVTEILFALGLGDRVVGVDLTSTFPAAARAKANVGYYRRISAEGILGLAPGMIVAADGSGPKEAIDVLAAASVRLAALREIREQRDIGARIREVADAVGEPAKGEALAGAVEADLSALDAELKSIAAPRRTLVLLGGQGGSLTAAGAATTGDLALGLAGASNAAAGMTGWKPLVDEAALGFAPEAVVIVAAGSRVSVETVAKHPGLASSPAVREGRVVIADALAFLGFGPRAAHAALDVARKVYSERSFADLPARSWVADAS